MQEPRDGDFVADIDALQRKSAARLAQLHVGAFRALTEQPSNKSAIDQVVGRSGTQKTATGP